MNMKIEITFSENRVHVKAIHKCKKRFPPIGQWAVSRNGRSLRCSNCKEYSPFQRGFPLRCRRCGAIMTPPMEDAKIIAGIRGVSKTYLQLKQLYPYLFLEDEL